MTGAHGQATVEWAGLLALAAVIGSCLALIAGPPLVGAVRAGLASALTGDAGPQRTPLAATAADIADVQAALTTTGTALTPDAALLALGRRHGARDARELADRILLAEAMRQIPALGRAVTYRPHPRVDHRIAGRVPEGNDDRDVETPTGPATATWVTTAAQRVALASVLTHHTSKVDAVLDVASLIPVPGSRKLAELGAGGVRYAARLIVRHAQDTFDDARTGLALADSLDDADDGVPGGLLAGDVAVSWPIHRQSWRHGAETRASTSSDGRHVVYLRATAGGLAIVGEEHEP